MARESRFNELIIYIHLVSMSLFAISMSEVCDGPVLPFEPPDTGFLEMEVIAGFRVWQLAFMGAMAILVLIIVLCCFFRCRIPRTKQEIEADVARKKVTKRFRSHLERLPVDRMELDKVLPEVIELEAKRLKRGEIEQKKTLFQKIKSIFFEDKEEEEDEDNVSKATVSFEEGTEHVSKKKEGEEDDDNEEEDEDEYEDETESSSEYDEHGEKIMKEPKKRRKKKDESLKGLRDDDDTSSEESKRIKKQYLSLSYKQSSSVDPTSEPAKSFPKTLKEEKKKNNTLDSVNITIEEEDENGVKPEDIETALERLRHDHMQRELQGKSSSTESRRSDNKSDSKVDDGEDGRSRSLPDKSGKDRKLSALVSKTIVKQKTCAAIFEHSGKKIGKKIISPKISPQTSSPQTGSTSRLAPTMSTFKGPIVHAVSTPVSPSTTLTRQSSKVKPVPPPKPASLTLLRSPQSSKDSGGCPFSPSSKHPQLSRQVELMEVEALKISSDGSKHGEAIYEEVTKRKQITTMSKSSTSSSSTTKCSCDHDHDEDDDDSEDDEEETESDSDEEESEKEKRTKF